MDAEKIPEVTNMILSVKVLIYDTKTAVRKEGLHNLWDVPAVCRTDDDKRLLGREGISGVIGVLLPLTQETVDRQQLVMAELGYDGGGIAAVSGS